MNFKIVPRPQTQNLDHIELREHKKVAIAMYINMNLNWHKYFHEINHIIINSYGIKVA